MGNPIRTIKCPYCGFQFASDKQSGTETCPMCMKEVSFDFSKQNDSGEKHVSYTDNSLGIMIGGGANKDPQSVIIFLEDYIDKHKKQICSTFNEVGLPEFEEVIKEIKLSHGAEKETWKLELLAVLSPLEARLEMIEEIKKEMIESIEKGEKHEKVYAAFDNYTEAQKDTFSILEELEFELTRGLERFKQYGGDGASIRELEKRIKDALKTVESFENRPENLEDIKEAKKALDDSNEKIALLLKNKYIEAEETYNRAKELEQSNNLTGAVYNYSLLGEYRDSARKVARLNQQFTFNDLFVSGKFYYQVRDHVSAAEKAETKRQLRKALRKEKKEAKTDEKSRKDVIGGDLVPLFNHEPEKDPAVSDYRSFLMTFGSLFYYISRKGTIHTYDLSTHIDKELEQKAHHLEDKFFESFANGTKGVILSMNKDYSDKNAKQLAKDAKKRARHHDYEPHWANQYRLDILNFGNENNLFEPLIEGITGVEQFENGAYISGDYIAVTKDTYDKHKNYWGKKKVFETKHRLLINLDSREIFEDVIGLNDKFVEISGDFVYFMQNSPTCYNQKLIKKNIRTKEEEVILDNIFKTIDVLDSKVFYTVGNTDEQTLFNYDMSTKEKHVVFEKFVDFDFYADGYFYLTRGNNYARTLFKISEDGEEFIVLATGLLKDGFRKVSNGYYYYENFNDELVRVRLDGSNRSVVAQGFESIVDINSQYVYYSTRETTDHLYEDERFKEGDKYLKGYSIYRYDVKTEMSEKILFNLHDWKYVYASKELYAIRRSEETYRSTNLKKRRNFNYYTIVENYYKINLETMDEELVMSLGLPHADKRRGCFLLRIFSRKKKAIEFERKPWIRPYLLEKERQL